MLQIKVTDNIKVVDTFAQAVKVIVAAFKKWVNSNDDKPFRLSVHRKEGRDPPALEVNVNESVKTETAFG